MNEGRRTFFGAMIAAICGLFVFKKPQPASSFNFAYCWDRESGRLSTFIDGELVKVTNPNQFKEVEFGQASYMGGNLDLIGGFNGPEETGSESG